MTNTIPAYRNPAGSAKYYSVYNFLSRLPKGSRVVCWSSGGHGCSVAASSYQLGMKATVVIPFSALESRVDLIKKYGATIIQSVDSVEECEAIARCSVGIPIHPYDDLSIIEGHQVLYDDVDYSSEVYVPVGGGGLLAAALLRLGNRAVGVIHESADSILRSLKAGRPSEASDISNAPAPVRVAKIGNVPFEIISHYKPRIEIVSDWEVKQAHSDLLSKGERVEFAGAIAYAAAKRYNKGYALLTGGEPTSL